jgi:hypothetical protein
LLPAAPGASDDFEDVVVEELDGDAGDDEDEAMLRWCTRLLAHGEPTKMLDF